jgi:hypothetical protein
LIRWFRQGIGGKYLENMLPETFSGGKAGWCPVDATGVSQVGLVGGFSENGGFREMLKRFWET